MDEMPRVATKEGETESEHIKLLESIVDTARNYHELYEPGPGRNSVANRLAALIHRLDEMDGLHFEAD